MDNNTAAKIRHVISQSVGGEFAKSGLPEDMRLVGNILDSMAVTKLIADLEENFGIMFEDEDLSAEAFETVASLTALVQKKLSA